MKPWHSKRMMFFSDLLFSGIRNVQKLILSPNTLKVLYLCCEWMPILLRNCPHLETLVLEGLLHFVTDKCGDACACISWEDNGRSLTSSPVKKLQIKGFRGIFRELNMIHHFLESFPCLKKMEVYAEENGPTAVKFPVKFYDKFYTCDVQFLVRGSLYKEWTAK